MKVHTELRSTREIPDVLGRAPGTKSASLADTNLSRL